ncbi:hypothetical protein C8Q76DRAFT_248308 [Earliella scabrosa]|nr:hypothetical protein C8Q76DRAFT_248308 [Earliella scabrosa]
MHVDRPPPPKFPILSLLEPQPPSLILLLCIVSTRHDPYTQNDSVGTLATYIPASHSPPSVSHIYESAPVVIPIPSTTGPESIAAEHRMEQKLEVLTSCVQSEHSSGEFHGWSDGSSAS